MTGGRNASRFTLYKLLIGMIKVHLKKDEGRNTAPPIEYPEQPLHSPTKVDGFGKSTEYGLGPAGDKDRMQNSQPRYAMEEMEECGCGCEEGEDIELDDGDGVKYFELMLSLEEQQDLNESLIYEKKDRCYYQAKQKYDVFPSAYASGYIVRCRKGKVGRKKTKNEEVELEEKWSDKYKRSIDCNNPKGFSQRAHCQGRKKHEEIELEESYELDIDGLLEEGTFDKEKEKSLAGWFDRQGGKGKSKGWVDCNTCRKDPKTGRKKCKTCGRQKGEKRSKYPACRPTPSACTRTGTSKKKGSMRVSWKKKKKDE